MAIGYRYISKSCQIVCQIDTNSVYIVVIISFLVEKYAVNVSYLFQVVGRARYSMISVYDQLNSQQFTECNELLIYRRGPNSINSLVETSDIKGDKLAGSLSKILVLNPNILPCNVLVTCNVLGIFI